MHENVNQPEQDLTQLDNPFSSGPLSQQDLALSVDSPYQETHVPYLPLPSESPQPKSPSLEADLRAANTPLVPQPRDKATSLPWQDSIMFGMTLLLGLLFGVCVFLTLTISPHLFWGTLLL